MIKDPKKQAAILKEYFKSKNIDVKLSYCYEAISKMHGYENWNTYSAILKRGINQLSWIDFEIAKLSGEIK